MALYKLVSQAASTVGFKKTSYSVMEGMHTAEICAILLAGSSESEVKVRLVTQDGSAERK